MILPTKRLPEDRALIRIGADILALLGEPKTISRLWILLRKRRAAKGITEVITFDWFVLGLDMLFALNLVDLNEGRLQKMEAA